MVFNLQTFYVAASFYMLDFPLSINKLSIDFLRAGLSFIN